ncbi:hypothetical protein COO60DRAFT_1546978 [Scenedesmus sp. NREL 46B-D3]|nr:hypothetical protein COO60DRAFT_1546978 [Scenedesmus sp. NREL 46B-D3]
MAGPASSAPGSNGQPVKRSCCSHNATAAGAAGGGAAAGGASPPPGLSWGAPSLRLPAATTPSPGLQAGAAGAAAAAAGGGGGGVPALTSALPHKQAAAAAGGGAGSSSSSVAVECQARLQRLGALLLPSGEMPGEVGLVLTGAGKCAVMDGPLPSKVHLLLMDQVEAVWLQDLSAQLPGYAGVGPCLVLRGRQAACGLLPACYLTDNPHVAIPLRQMSKACREHWAAAVLPAWQAATGSRREARGASSPWPLPPELQPAYRYWMQGQRKRFLVTQPDEAMDALVAALDKPREQQGLAA